MRMMRIFGWIVLGIIAILALSIATFALRWAGDATETLYQETSPQVLLKKYEWFKDASASLDSKVAMAQAFAKKIKAQENIPRSDWDRFDKQNYFQWRQELDGVIASYLVLAAEYNSQMAKINYRFANIGELPKGAVTPLPREYKPLDSTVIIKENEIDNIKQERMEK